LLKNKDTFPKEQNLEKNKKKRGKNENNEIQEKNTYMFIFVEVMIHQMLSAFCLF